MEFGAFGEVMSICNQIDKSWPRSLQSIENSLQLHNTVQFSVDSLVRFGARIPK